MRDYVDYLKGHFLCIAAHISKHQKRFDCFCLRYTHPHMTHTTHSYQVQRFSVLSLETAVVRQTVCSLVIFGLHRTVQLLCPEAGGGIHIGL